MELTEDLMLYLVALRDEMRQRDSVEVVVPESETGELNHSNFKLRGGNQVFCVTGL